MRAYWLWCLLLILSLIPADAVGARPVALAAKGPTNFGLSSLTAKPNPVIIPYGMETGSTTITWNSGTDIVPELWVPDRASHREMLLPGITASSGSYVLTVQLRQPTTVSLYTPGHSLLLNSVTITTQRPSDNAGSVLPTPTLAPVPSDFNKASLQPSNVYTTYRANDEVDGLCFSPGVFGNLRVGGTDPDTPWDTITVGYVHHYDDNNGSLIPCTQTFDTFFRGAVRFDLNGFSHYNFSHATLTFRVLDSWRHYDVGGLNADAPGIWSAAGGMDLATDDWPDWPARSDHDYLNGDGAQIFVAPERVNSPTITLDVTVTVQGWLEGTTPNFGFVFYGKDEGYPRNSDTLISSYTDFVLTLAYR